MTFLLRKLRFGATVIGLGLVCASFANATNYYVDCNYGSNGNPGTSPQQAWRTLLEVGISSFQPGDTINLLRDCTWNETLTPPSSGNSSSLIKIDSYGNGQPPHLTGYLPVAARWWTQGWEHQCLGCELVFDHERVSDRVAMRYSRFLLPDTAAIAVTVCALWHDMGNSAGKPGGAYSRPGLLVRLD